MIRPETKSRARALQILYAWEIQDGPDVPHITTGLARLTGPAPRILDAAEGLALAVVTRRAALDKLASAAADNWRLTRIASIERNILRLGILQLQDRAVPPKVVIDESVRLARWFGGARAGLRQRGPGSGGAHPWGAVNILLVNWLDLDNPQAGGAEVHLFELFGRLAARGHRVRLLCSGWPGAPARATVAGIAVERVGGRNSFALRGRGAVRRALRHEPPDVVVEDINKLPLFLARLTAAPFCVLVPHLFGSTAFQEASWPAATVVWLAERPIPRAYRRADFHAISESTRDDLVARGVPRQRIRVIHPGVDAVALSPGPDRERSEPPRFLYVGRLKRYKGLDLAIRALAQARQVRPELSLDIAGSGDDRPRLERLIADLGQGQGVRLHGRVSEETKLDLLRRATANVFPSPKEGWGITIIEAAACGTPSLASDSPGLRDSVRDGETGFLVPHGDVAMLAQRMLQLAGDPALVERLGRNARRLAEGLSWDRAADATEAHLLELCAAQGRA